MLEDRIQPQSLEAEQATLGACLIEKQAIETAARIVRPHDFYRDAHRRIYESILRLFDRKEPVDFLTLRTELEATGELEGCGGFPYLVQLTDALPTATNIEAYASVVAEKAGMRRLIAACSEIHSLAYRAHEFDDVHELYDQAERITQAVRGRNRTSDVTPIRTIVDTVFDSLEAATESGAVQLGVTTGIGELDDLTLGLNKSDLIIIGAEPSMGKTALALRMALEAIEHKMAIAFFSLEMTKEQLTQRLISMDSGINLMSLRRGLLKPEEWVRVGDACSKIRESKLTIMDTNMTALEIASRARQIQTESGLDVIFVDYLTQIQSVGRTENRTQEIGTTIRAMKGLAKELSVPNVVLAQLNRSQGKPEKPILRRLRDSGDIEAAADVVLFPWRPSYQADKEQGQRATHEDDAAIIIAKQRQGPTCEVPVRWTPWLTRWDSRPAHYESSLPYRED